MNIKYRTKKLENECTNIKVASKQYGDKSARRIIMILYGIDAAERLCDLSPLPPMRCHRLKGELKQLLAIDLEQPNRLILKAIDEKGNFLNLDKVKFSQICNVKIMEVSKHYD